MFTYVISDDYLIEDIKIEKKLINFFKKDENELLNIQKYIKDRKNKFCRNTGLSEFLGNFDNLLLVYNEHELSAASAVSFVYNDTEDKIIGIHIPFFCSKIKGYGSLLLQQIMSLCKSHKWFIGLNPLENSHGFYVKHGFRKINDLYYYNL